MSGTLRRPYANIYTSSNHALYDLISCQTSHLRHFLNTIIQFLLRFCECLCRYLIKSAASGRSRLEYAYKSEHATQCISTHYRRRLVHFNNFSMFLWRSLTPVGKKKSLGYIADNNYDNIATCCCVACFCRATGRVGGHGLLGVTGRIMFKNTW